MPAPFTKAQLTTEIGTNWPDNNSGAITPALLRSTVLDLLNSYGGLADINTFSAANSFNAGITITTSFSATNLVTNASLAQMNANTIKGNNTGGLANAADLTPSQLAGMTEQGMTFIEVLTASNSATLTTSVFTAAYDDYVFVFDNIVPITDSVNFNATVESGGTFQATTYLNATAATTSIDLETASTISNSAGKGYVGTLYLYNVNSASVNKFMVGRGVYALTATFVPTSINVAGYWNGGQGAVTRVRFQMSSGNISTGSIKVFGLRNAL